MRRNTVAKAQVWTLPPRNGASQTTSKTGVKAQAEAVKLMWEGGDSAAPSRLEGEVRRLRF